jgi:hypothetical protein
MLENGMPQVEDNPDFIFGLDLHIYIFVMTAVKTCK